MESDDDSRGPVEAAVEAAVEVAVDRAEAGIQKVEAAVQRAEEVIRRAEDVAADDVEWVTEWAARPVMRGWMHTAAVPVVAGLTTFAVTRASERKVRIATAVYAASVTTMLSASAAYHRLSRTRAQADVMQRADHAVIFAAIAGSMTPFVVIALPTPVMVVALSGIWSAAAAGMLAKILYLDEDRPAGSWGYATLGWAGAGIIIPIIRRAGWVTAAEVAAGGVLYTVGAALFRSKKPDLFPGVFGYHEVWHTFVLGGVGFHIDAVRRAVATQPPSKGSGPSKRSRWRFWSRGAAPWRGSA